MRGYLYPTCAPILRRQTPANTYYLTAIFYTPPRRMVTLPLRVAVGVAGGEAGAKGIASSPVSPPWCIGTAFSPLPRPRESTIPLHILFSDLPHLTSSISATPPQEPCWRPRFRTPLPPRAPPPPHRHLHHRLLLPCREGVPLHDLAQYLEGPDGAPQLVEVRIAPEYVSAHNKLVKARQLWGCDIYTEDSDLVAAAMHMGFFSFNSAHPPAPISEFRAVIKPLPPQVRSSSS